MKKEPLLNFGNSKKVMTPMFNQFCYLRIRPPKLNPMFTLKKLLARSFG